MTRPRILAIDPGSRTHGVVLADCSGDLPIPEVVSAAMSHRETIELIRRADRVFVERYAPHEKTGWTSIQTAENVGGLREAASLLSRPCHLLTRSDWLKLLRVRYGKGADSRVRRWVVAQHGGDPRSRSRRDLPRALKGITSHAWQAMGLLHAGLVSWRGR